MVEVGLALSEALDKCPEVFCTLYVEMVRAGEIGGVLDDVLLRIAHQLEKDRVLGRKVNSAMAYPTVVLVLAVLAASFMLIFIVPIFAWMCEDLGGTLPLPTLAAMSFSDVLTSPFRILIYAAMDAGVLLFLRWRKPENGRAAVDPPMLKIPFKIGDVVQKVVLARFARTLGAVSAAGVPLLQAL